MEKGEEVDAKFIATLITNELKRSNKSTVIAEGYLRNLSDISFFEKQLKNSKSVIILLKTSEKTCIERTQLKRGISLKESTEMV